MGSEFIFNLMNHPAKPLHLVTFAEGDGASMGLPRDAKLLITTAIKMLIIPLVVN